MPDTWTSDWEKLFAKCVADPDFRRRLGEALAERSGSSVEKLLGNIGVLQGKTREETDARVTALLNAYKPLYEVAEAFSERVYAEMAG